MFGKVKKSGYKNGQGYCGWYTNKDGKKMFLRSTKEFIYASYLDSLGYHFLTEKSSFDICGKMYKPDFFLYDEAYINLIKIIEVKDTKKKATGYIDRFGLFFNMINIKYEVVWEFRKIIKDLALEDNIKEWVKNFEETYDRISVSGKNNPMWGMKHSNKTKRLIGSKTKEYMKDPEIKTRHSTSIRGFWNSDAALEIKEKYRNLRHEEKINRDRKLDSINPNVDKKCIMCGKIFSDRIKNKRKTCSNSCTQKYNWKIGLKKYCGNGKKSYKTRMLKYSREIIKDNGVSENDFFISVLEAKKHGVIPENFAITANAVNNYFGSFDNFVMEVKNG